MLHRTKKPEKIYIDISARTIFKLLGISLVVLLGVIFVRETLNIITLIVVAFFFAMALNPAVSYLTNKLPSGSRGRATGISYAVVLSALGLLMYATIPPVVRQTQTFIDNIPSYIEEVRTGEGFIPETVERFELEDRLDELQNNLSASNITSAGGPLLSFFQRISGSVISVLTVLVLTFFMLVEGPSWLKKFWSVHPKEHRAHRQHIAQKMHAVVVGYVNGQLLVAFIAAMTTLIFMTILKLFDINIPFILPLAAIVGVFGLIPLIGATLAAVVLVTVSLFESVAAAVIMAIFFLIYQQIENNAIQPIIQGRSVELSPLAILIAALLGASLAGLLGAIFSIPVAAWIRILVNDYFEHHHTKEVA